KQGRNAGKEGNGRVFSRFAGGLGRTGPLSIVRRADFGRAGRNQRPKQLQPATGRLVPEAARGRSKRPALAARLWRPGHSVWFNVLLCIVKGFALAKPLCCPIR